MKIALQTEHTSGPSGKKTIQHPHLDALGVCPLYQPGQLHPGQEGWQSCKSPWNFHIRKLNFKVNLNLAIKFNFLPSVQCNALQSTTFIPPPHVSPASPQGWEMRVGGRRAPSSPRHLCPAQAAATGWQPHSVTKRWPKARCLPIAGAGEEKHAQPWELLTPQGARALLSSYKQTPNNTLLMHRYNTGPGGTMPNC